MTFTIYPAIDLRHGRVVRLQHGDPERQTVFSDDPLAVAEQWLAAGATWLHVVNLDGAFDEAGAANWQALSDICNLGANVQFGGGLRTVDDVRRAFDLGIDRAVLGTAAIENPDLLYQSIHMMKPKSIAVGIDARDGRVQTHGWLQNSVVTPAELGKRMRALGVQTAVYTDINRDGVLAGVNAEAAAELAQATDLQVIASGGVASLDDIRRCHALAAQGVTGVIVGRALYDGRISLKEAFSLVK
jgi:phosphoribosylformimino-5-aminoimidazole carboxamide ribotide isomerase